MKKKRFLSLITYSFAILVIAVPIWIITIYIRKYQRDIDLFIAIRANNSSKVIELVKSGIDIDIRDPKPSRRFEDFPRNLLWDGPFVGGLQTPLEAALYDNDHSSPRRTFEVYKRYPNPQIISALLDRGAKGDVRFGGLSAYIGDAVKSGRFEVLELLMKHRASIKDSDQRSLLLMNAANGKIEMMQYLLSHGVDVNEWDKNGETALIYNVRCICRVDAVKFLIKHHAEISMRDKAGNAALFYAQNPSTKLVHSQTKHLQEIVEILKKAGAK